MSNHQVLLELIVDVFLVTALEVLDKFLEHLTKDLKFYFVDSSEDLNSNGLIDWEHLRNSRRAETGKLSSGFFELSLLKVNLGVLHQVSV